MSVNLNDLAVELAREEKGDKQVSIAQIKEILGILGRRWRSLSFAERSEEFWAIYERAGTSIKVDPTDQAEIDALSAVLEPYSPDLVNSVRIIVANNLEVRYEEVELDSHLSDDLGMDSLDKVSIQMQIEETFDLHTIGVTSFSTVRDIVEFVVKHRGDES